MEPEYMIKIGEREYAFCFPWTQKDTRTGEVIGFGVNLGVKTIKYHKSGLAEMVSGLKVAL
jgi:hypothetical protein